MAQGGRISPHYLSLATRHSQMVCPLTFSQWQAMSPHIHLQIQTPPLAKYSNFCGHFQILTPSNSLPGFHAANSIVLIVDVLIFPVGLEESVIVYRTLN